MNYHDSVQVYEALQSGDEHLRLQLLRTAIRYTNMRVEWLFMTSAERLEVDRQRTAAPHSGMISASSPGKHQRNKPAIHPTSHLTSIVQRRH
ncbi:MAG: hypothetical protein WCI20_11340 [bacterium]